MENNKNITKEKGFLRKKPAYKARFFAQ